MISLDYYTIESLLKEKFINFYKNYNLVKNTPFKYKLISKLIIYPQNQNELISAVKILSKNTKNKIYCFGNFSNSIIHEKSEILNHPIIITKNLKKFDINLNQNFCEVEAGYPIPKFSSILSKKGFTGFSGLLGIPGSIGGGIFMNAGSFGNEISDKLISVKYLDNNLDIKNISTKHINFDWRFSGFQKDINHVVILSAKFKLERGNIVKIKKHFYISKNIRAFTQEKAGNNFGSVFATQWIYDESQCNDVKYILIKKILNFLFRLSLFLRIKFLTPIITKQIIRFNKYYFNFYDNNKIEISNKSLNCFLIRDENTKPSDYIYFIENFKKKFKPKCKVEIQIYD